MRRQMDESNWKLRVPALWVGMCVVSVCLSRYVAAKEAPGIHLLPTIQTVAQESAPKFQPNVPPLPYGAPAYGAPAYEASAYKTPADEAPHSLYLSFLDESNDEEKSDESLDESLDIDSLAKRLDELESNYGDLSSDHDSLQEEYDDLKKSLKYYVQAGHKSATMKVVGRIHIDHWAFPGDSPGVNAFESGDPTISPQDRIGFRRVRFGVRGDLWDNMLYRIEMEFAGGNESEFRDVFIGIKDLPILQTVLVGNQKRPYGLDHLNSSRYNVFIERPFVIEAFNQDARRLGITSHGVSRNEAWNWRYGVYNQRLIQDEGNYISDHYQLEFAARLANTFWYDESSGGRGYAHWGLAGTIANPDGTNNGSAAPANPFGRGDNEARFRHRPEARTVSRWLDTGVIEGAGQYELLGLEGVLNIGAFQLVGEYQNVWVQRFDQNEVHFHGGYAYLSYFLTGEHIPWDRKTGTLGRVKPFTNFSYSKCRSKGARKGCGAWQVAARWSFADFTDGDVATGGIAGGIGESVTLGINWHWNPYARMQFNYIYGNIHSRAPVAGQTFGNYQIVGTRFMVDF